MSRIPTSFRPSSFSRAPRGSVVTSTRLRPEFAKFEREQREIQLAGQRQALLGQKQRQNVFSQLTSSLLGGGGNISQPGGPDTPGGVPGIGGAQGLLSQLLGDIGRLGGSQRQRINEGFDASLQSQLAGLSDRGLGGSTLAANLATGAERGKQTALTELEDALLGRKIGATQQIGLAGLQQQQQLLLQLLGLLGQG